MPKHHTSFIETHCVAMEEVSDLFLLYDERIQSFDAVKSNNK